MIGGKGVTTQRLDAILDNRSQKVGKHCLRPLNQPRVCLLYTSDAADEEDRNFVRQIDVEEVGLARCVDGWNDKVAELNASEQS